MKKIILSLACLFPLASFAYINTGSSLPAGVVTTSDYFVPSAISNNCFYVYGTGTKYDGFYTNAFPVYTGYRDLTNLIALQTAGTYVLLKQVNDFTGERTNFMYSSSSLSFSYWRISNTTNTGAFVVLNRNSVANAANNPVATTYIQYGGSGVNYPTYQVGFAISYATNAAVASTNFYGKFAGDGQYLNNVPLGTGAVSTATALASNLIAVQAGPATASYFFTNPFVQHEASSLFHKDSSVEQWGALTKPPIVFQITQFILPKTNGIIQSNVLALANYITTNGMLANYTNAGFEVVFWIDGLLTGPRNTNYSTVIGGQTYSAGNLTPTYTNNYPLGVPWLASSLHSNGISLWVEQCLITNKLPSGAKGWLFDSCNGNIYAYTNYSDWFTSQNGMCAPGDASNPDSLYSDLAELKLWGVDGVVNNYNTISDQADVQASMISSACRNMKIGWVGSTFGFDFKQLFTRPLVYMQYCTYSIFGSTVEGTMFGNTIRRYANVQVTDNTQTPVTASLLRRMIGIEFSGCKSASQGGYALTSSSDTGNTNSMAARAMISGVACKIMQQVMTFPAAGYETNNNWQRITLDPLQAMPVLQSDYGTNIGSAWLKPLASGDFAALMFNESGIQTTNITLTFKGYAKLNKGVDVYDGWTTNFIGTYTNSYTAAVTTNGSVWLYCSPQ